MGLSQALSELPTTKRGSRNEIGSRGLKSQALRPRCGRTPSKGEPVQKGRSNLFLGCLYALTTAARLATQAPLSFLAAKQLSVAVFIGATELILLLCVPFMLRTRRSREHFVALLSSASNLVKLGALLLIGLIGIVLYVFGLGRIRSSSLQSSISTHSGRPSLHISPQVRRSRLRF